MIQTASASFVLPASLPLEDGGLLFNAELAYEAYGRVSNDNGNGVVLLHDLWQSHRALGPLEDSAYQPSGWGRALVGESRALDPRVHWILSPNLLGSPFGSTSPCSKDAESGQSLGSMFPALTLDDLARSTAALLRGLQIRRVRALVGYGLGGLLALRIASLFPELSSGVVALGAARALPSKLRERMTRSPGVLAADPAFADGGYKKGEGPRQTLKGLRAEWMRQTSTREQLLLKYGDSAGVERGLEAEAQAFANSFDANCFALLCNAYGRADIGPDLGKVQAKVLLVTTSTSAVAPPAHVRDTQQVLAASRVASQVCEVPSELGQHGLIAEPEQLKAVVAAFLSSLDRER